MDALILVVVVAAVYVAYINRDKIKARFKPAAPSVAPAPVAPTPTPAAPVAPTVALPVAPPVAPFVSAYNGVGEPFSQDAWTAWRASLDPARRGYYPPIWKPTPVQPSGSGDTVPTFRAAGGNLVSNDVLRPGERFLATGTLGVIQAFPIAPGASRVTISETSGTGDNVRYNLWVSSTPAGVPADPVAEFQYNSATVQFAPSAYVQYANVRAMVDGGRPFYIQAN